VTRIPIPVFPTPGAKYDPEDESQFRRVLENFLQEVSFSLETALTSPEPSNMTGTASLTYNLFTITASGTIGGPPSPSSISIVGASNE